MIPDEAVQTFEAADRSMNLIFDGLADWLKVLDTDQRDEALFLLNRLANDWHDLHAFVYEGRDP